jgi:hypothetical protein
MAIICFNSGQQSLCVLERCARLVIIMRERLDPNGDLAGRHDENVVDAVALVPDRRCLEDAVTALHELGKQCFERQKMDKGRYYINCV